VTIRSDEVVELLVALIRNACVNDGTPDSGHEARSVDTLAEYLGARGTEFEPHPGRRSTIYRIPGTDPDAPSLMLMGHLDVVPVSSDGWSRDPFGGERHDGFIWGRGAIDMLNQTAAMAAVFRRHLSDDAAPLPGDLLFLAVADEEAGGVLGARWLVDEHWDAVGCDYLLTEIGTPFLHGATGTGLPVTVAEKGPQWRRLTSRGTPGHGSQPYGTANALTPLAGALGRLADSPPGAHITDEWRRFVGAWGPADDLHADLLDPDRVDDAIDRIALDDLGLARWIHACTHLTVSPNTMSAGVKANVIPDLAVAEVDIRSLPGQDESDVLDHFRKVIGPPLDDLDVETVEATSASGSDPSGPLWDALAAATADMAPGVGLIPAMIPVGTDARFFRRRGTVAYGVGLFDERVTFGDFLRMFHGHDERVSEASLSLTTDLLARTVERFGRATA
jgi:acetylornithine deacetylase/succinyl-diaminopimelate desuccinylase-like protein